MTDSRGLIERFNAAWQHGDLRTLSSLLDEDVVYCPNAWDGPASAVHGRDAVVAVFAEQIGPTEPWLADPGEAAQVEHGEADRVDPGEADQAEHGEPGRADPGEAEHDEHGDGPVLGDVFASGDRAVCEWAWPPAEDGTVLRGVDVYRTRDGRIVAKDVYGKITAPPPR
ncbi:nuclear transport factor 2 family protein [Actinoplanes sp. CA-252034]|uniref:nuclear transport factor 2 family protein n=1 Tax=Actinoplanes sp. CA-252034 TaxID=3239906 RepID=UPI003D993997